MMMPDEKYALTAARLLREQLPPDDCAIEDLPRRDRVVAAMELAMARQRHRRRLVKIGLGTLSAAAAIVVALKLSQPGPQVPLVVEQLRGPDNVLVRAASSQDLSASAQLWEGDEIRSGETGGATLRLGRGTRLSLAADSHLRVQGVGRTRRFLLLAGQVEAQVSKLRARERFVVTTPDSEVEVRGTRFIVGVADSPAGCGGADKRSTVTVLEGAVWVRSGGQEVVLGPGQSFARPCPVANAHPEQEPHEEQPQHEAATAPSPAHQIPRRRALAPLPTPERRPPPPVVQPKPAAAAPLESHLAEENDLLSAALAAERAGQHELAIRRLDDLLTRFPGGPLSQTAHAERQRIKAAQRRPNEP